MFQAKIRGVMTESGKQFVTSSHLLASGFPSIANLSPRSPFRQLYFSTSATPRTPPQSQLVRSDECALACHEGEPPRICYYFTVEYYIVLGAQTGGRSERSKRFKEVWSKLVNTCFEDVGGMDKTLCQLKIGRIKIAARSRLFR
ncbi:hypothetical protein pipiens_017117 [Culex pipiens pipiens]|uniref:Uncharacterized protein n=1 Tax=Culex pipiens pipiens TaxID=38569 RepID=A0ABD1CI14_CULPP